MQRQQNSLVQIGVGIAILGFAVKVVLMVGVLLTPLATSAIVGGVILAIVGLMTPGRR